jgi:predicted AlkP superfamily phosphohydrolase/phosphomutase/tetratricopeptide (TPR) repeat protein
MIQGNRNAKVLLIGWDGADWKLIQPLVDAGKMPNLAKFIEEGVIGNLATLYPELSPMLWTSIATGKRPFKHGILGFVEPDPHRGGIRPISNISRKTKAVWNVLSQTGRRCNIVGWWPSHPAEPINGVMVSNHYQRAAAPFGQPWPMRPGTVHPERLVKNLAALRLHPQELDVGLILNFVPRLAEIDQENDHRIENLAKVIADCTTINLAATALMHHEAWDFTAVYFDAIDHFCHGFMHFHPPQLPWVEKKDFELYQNVVESGYIYHDLLLGALLDKTDGGTTVLIVSDHGFHSDHLRPRSIPREPAGPVVQHRPHGILAAKGPGIKRDEIIYGCSLLDICPTILTLFGLPVGGDMDGKPLLNVFVDPSEITTLASWDEVAGEDGSHPPDLIIDPMEAREVMHQLIALGYVEKPDEDRELAVEEAVRELRYNLARSYIDAGQHASAAPILHELAAKWADEYRFGIQLVTCYQATEKTHEARSVLEELFQRKDKNARRAAAELKELNERTRGKRFEELSRQDQQALHRLRVEASRNPYAMEYLMGSLLIAEGNAKEALRHLKRAEKADSARPELRLKLGEAYFRLKAWAEAERSYQKALAIDPENAEAFLGLARIYLAMRRNRDAAECALNSLGLKYHSPLGHYLLGLALHRLGRLDEAVTALHLAVTQNPLFPEAHERLAHIFLRRLKDAETAEQHRELAREGRARIRAFRKGVVECPLAAEDAARTALTSEQVLRAHLEPPSADGPVLWERTAVIVSGLPRSGTSMMMQMLEAGGVALYTDGSRAPNEDNPKGYYEHEKAKQLERDNSWLSETAGKAVKIVAQLLGNLPRTDVLDYRVIFMERDLKEVLKSQKAMIKRQGKPGTRLTDERLWAVFHKQVQQARAILALKRIPALCLDYNTVLQHPAETAARVNAFLGGSLDEAKMLKAVEPRLKRQGHD